MAGDLEPSAPTSGGTESPAPPVDASASGWASEGAQVEAAASESSSEAQKQSEESGATAGVQAASGDEEGAAAAREDVTMEGNTEQGKAEEDSGAAGSSAQVPSAEPMAVDGENGEETIEAANGIPVGANAQQIEPTKNPEKQEETESKGVSNENTGVDSTNGVVTEALTGVESMEVDGGQLANGVGVSSKSVEVNGLPAEQVEKSDEVKQEDSNKEATPASEGDAKTEALGNEENNAQPDQTVSGKRKERETDHDSGDIATQDEASTEKKQKTDSAGTSAAVETDPAAPIAATPIMISRDDMAKMEEDDGTLKFDVITNDGDPEHMVQLTTLKNIFAKQLPKMPKEYIVRLVFDRNHRSMIILKNGKHVIGGICYRPFEPNHFAEIAFCAINASDQVKGYGTRLMNHLKEYVKLKGISYFLTYADNYAIGYFKKQGFSKVVSMPRPNWFGYIKDYDGGTLMECTIHHQINYLRITSMVQKQRQAILDKIKQNSRAHIVYPGLTNFAEGRLLDIYMIPGVKEAGWSQATIRNNRIGTRDPGSLKTQLTQLWKAVSSHRSAWPFHEPVDTSVVVDYLDYIKEPIDLQLIGKRVESGTYVSKAQFKADLDKMCTNCTVYNSPDTNYYKAAVDLQEFINKRVQVRDQPR